MRAGIGLLKPRIELQLEVEVIGKAPSRLEVRLEVSLQALDDALGLRIGCFAEVPVEEQLPAEAGIGIGRSTAACVQAPPRDPRPSRAGNAPSENRQRLMPHRTSGACLLKISAPAPARE